MGRTAYFRHRDSIVWNMASLIWLIVWVVQGTPDLEWFGSWNDWAVALLGCLIFDVFSGREAGRTRGRRTTA